MRRKIPTRGEPEKPPAFQFYARAWLSSTRGMSYEAKGAYVDLLSWAWDNGPLPVRAEWRRYMLGADADRLWRAVRAKWTRTPAGWINPRLESQRRELAIFTARAKRAAAARWEQASPQASARPRRKQSTPDSVLRTPIKKAAAPPFTVYRAIAHRAIAETPGDDLGAIAETFKRLCAQQGKPYNATVTQKAIDAARGQHA